LQLNNIMPSINRYTKNFDPKRQQWFGVFRGEQVTGFYDSDDLSELEQKLEDMEEEFELHNERGTMRPFKDYFETVYRTGKPAEQVELAKSYLNYKKKQPWSRQ
jgi:hypothetical protein